MIRLLFAMDSHGMVMGQPARYYNLLATLEELSRQMGRAETSEG